MEIPMQEVKPKLVVLTFYCVSVRVFLTQNHILSPIHAVYHGTYLLYMIKVCWEILYLVTGYFNQTSVRYGSMNDHQCMPELRYGSDSVKRDITLCVSVFIQHFRKATHTTMKPEAAPPTHSFPCGTPISVSLVARLLLSPVKHGAIHKHNVC